MPNTGAIWGSIGIKTTELKRGLNDAERQLRTFVNSTKNAFKGLLVGTAGLAGLGFTLKKAFDFAAVGANIEKQKVAFKSLAASVGQDSDDLLKHLNEVSRGTVSNMDLIASASKAMLLGIAPERLTELLSIARAASKATGDTVTKSFNDIAIGIGRQSKLILDNLGIIVSVEEANEKFARSLKKKSSELTDAEQKQAFLNATLEAGRKIIARVGTDYDSTSDVIDRTKVAFTELKVQLSAIFTTLSAKLLPRVAETVTNMHEWIKANELLINQKVTSWVDGIGEAIIRLVPALRALGWVTEKVAEGYKGLIDLYLFAEKLPSRSEQEIINLKKETDEIKNQIEIKKKRLSLSEKELQVVMDSRRLELPELDILPEGYGRKSFQIITEDLRKTAEDWEDIMKSPFEIAIEKVKELRRLLDYKLIDETQFKRGILEINMAFITAQKEIQKTKLEAKRLQNGLEELDQEVQYKIEDFEVLGSTTEDIFSDMKDAVNGWASDFSRTLNDMLWGSEVTFASIAESFGKMITQMLLQKAVIEPFMESFFGLMKHSGITGSSFSGFFNNIFRGGAGKGNPLVGMTAAGGGGGFFGTIPGFAEGGVVPGVIGTPVPIIAHAGETVVPINKSMNNNNQPMKVQVILNNPIDPRMFQKTDEEVVTVVADHYSRGSIITEVIRRDVGGGG